MHKFLLIGLMGILLSACQVSDTQVVLQDIKFTPAIVPMTVGNSLQLDPVFEPVIFNSIPVTWSTSDPSLATVSQTGLVNAVHPGEVVITIQDQNSATAGRCHIIIQ